MSEAPSHYKILDGQYEVRDIQRDRLNTLNRSPYKPLDITVYTFYSNAIKYLLRWFLKGGMADLKKCKGEVDEIIQYYENQEYSKHDYPNIP